MNLATAQALAHTLKTGGGGGKSAPKSYLYTFKVHYKLFGLLIFTQTFTQIPKFHLKICSKNADFCNLGKYIATTPNIEQQIFTLIKGLSQENKDFVLRQISRSKQAYDNDCLITDLTKEEIKEISYIYNEFYPNILELSENLYYYKGYYLPIKAFIAGIFVHKHCLDIFTKQTLENIKTKEVIDVGGFIGDSAILFEKEFTDKNVYTFEPTKENHELTKRTIQLNNSSRIIPIKMALGANKSTMQINTCAGGCSSMAFHITDRVENVEVTTLDIFAKEHNLKIGLIKVDIEGFEMQFLQGAKETICAQKPALCISIYHSGDDYFNIKPLIESWNLGYKFQIYKRIDGDSLTTDTSLFCEVLE